MTQFRKKFFSALASGALLLNVVTPVAAESTLQITGNGANSTSNVNVELEQQTTVVQSNSAVVTNNIDADAKTGGNTADYNTGGDVTIWTGDADTDVSVANLLNKNVATVDCCDLGDFDVLISENGAESDNQIDLTVNEEEGGTEVFQENLAVVTNNVDADAKTGGNSTGWNTGGDVAIRTGTADTSVEVLTAANANFATIGGEEEGGGELSMRIIGNGAYSDNSIAVELEHQLTVVQENLAVVTNNIDADAKTGYNDADYNTGGDTTILTGDADTDVTVDNWLNFNAADVNCFCLFSDLLAKIDGNGYESDNQIDADLDDVLEVFQGGEGPGNDAVLTNNVDGDSKTGYNGTDWNTGDPDGDPIVLTGNADSVTDVYNAANMNVYGDFGLEFDWDFGWLGSML